MYVHFLPTRSNQLNIGNKRIRRSKWALRSIRFTKNISKIQISAKLQYAINIFVKRNWLVLRNYHLIFIIRNIFCIIFYVFIHDRHQKMFWNLCRKMWHIMDFNQTKRLINQQFYDFKTTIWILSAKSSCFYRKYIVTFHRTME